MDITTEEKFKVSVVIFATLALFFVAGYGLGAKKERSKESEETRLKYNIQLACEMNQIRPDELKFECNQDEVLYGLTAPEGDWIKVNADDLPETIEINNPESSWRSLE